MKTKVSVLNAMVTEIVEYFGQVENTEAGIHAAYDALPFDEFDVPTDEVTPCAKTVIMMTDTAIERFLVAE